MEDNLIRVPFDIELAKKIASKEIDGYICAENGEDVRILCFDAKGDKPIVGLRNENDKDMVVSFYPDGRNLGKGSRCHYLTLYAPKYLTFKDGDIIYVETENPGGTVSKRIIILKGNIRSSWGKISYEAYVSCILESIYIKNKLAFGEHIVTTGGVRIATEREQYLLLEYLQKSKDPKAKGCLERFFGVIEAEVPSCEFTTGQQVLGKDGSGQWRYDLFSHYNPQAAQGKYVCTGRSYTQCLPYNEETKHLVGTTAEIEKTEIAIK